MLFNSLEFLIFYPLVAIAYFHVQKRDRWMVLLGASYYFYMRWQMIYILLIIGSTLLDFNVAIAIEKANTLIRRKRLLFLSLGGNLGLLFFFKYYNFFADSINAATGLVGALPQLPPNSLLLPVGISFYTFQTLSYTIEVYLRRQKAETNIGTFAIYVAFFPQLVAGPIERPQRLLKQICRDVKFDYDRAVSGLQVMLWGFFKKMVIADNLGLIVDRVYGAPGEFQGPAYVLATVLFAFQIFCDFSGYSDIAVGSARVMGIDLMKNFDRPYFAKSIPEFWRRWHISLSTWFRDYVYIPLGGSHVSGVRKYGNLFAVFAVSGLWHGANWTFVVWGVLHFAFYTIGMATEEPRRMLRVALGLDKLPLVREPLQVAATFCLVCFSWIFFRANSMTDAWIVVSGLASGWFAPSMLASLRDDLLLGEPFALLIGILALLAMETFHFAERAGDNFARLSRQPRWARWAAYYATVAVILTLGVFDSRQFIYFQF